MENISTEFLTCLNLARTSPKQYITLLEGQLGSFISNTEILLNDNIVYEVNEGKNAWIEAKHFLLKQAPLHSLVRHQGLCRAADEHRKDICENGTFDHRGKDGSSFCERILRHCKKGPGAMAEMIGLDFNLPDRKTAMLTVLGLIIDDGISDRGHRKTIFSPTYKYVGWSTGVQGQKIITVFNLLENDLAQLGIEKENAPAPAQKNSPKLQKRRSNFLGSWQEVPFQDISNKPQTKPIIQPVPSKLKRQISQKQENTRTFFEQGVKVVETTTKIVYRDGTTEEKVTKKMFYEDEV